MQEILLDRWETCGSTWSSSSVSKVLLAVQQFTEPSSLVPHAFIPRGWGILVFNLHSPNSRSCIIPKLQTTKERTEPRSRPSHLVPCRREFRIKKNKTITPTKTKSQPPRAKYDEANDELAAPHHALENRSINIWWRLKAS